MTNNRNKRWLLLPSSIISVLAIGLTAGCPTPEEELPPGPKTDCVSNEAYFQESVWNPIMSSSCYACHNPQGQAHYTDMVFQNSNQPNYLINNLRIAEEVAAFEKDGTSILLLKPSAQIEHGGGEVIKQNGSEYQALEAFVKRSKSPIVCEENENDTFWDGIQLLDNTDTLRKASLLLVGRLPTEDEVETVTESGEDGLNSVLLEMMESPQFRGYAMEVFNDLFMTDRYRGGNNATDLLDDDDYPNNRFYSDLSEDDNDEEYIELANGYTNNSVASAPLQLVSYLIENDLPFTEVLTADYMVVNPFSALVYGIDNIDFDDERDPNEFKPGRIEGIPHAGILTSPMWLNRFPTTDTNRNRHRARMIYDFFLATDVMKLAERPVDPTSIIDFNPTMYNPQCSVCHSNIDPIAGAFQNWDEAGRFRPPEEGWFSDMRPPGYNDDTIPSNEWSSSLQWLGHVVTEDPLFALAITRNIYKALSGQNALLPPAPELTADIAAAQQAAFDAQDKILQTTAQAFIDSNYNLKTVFTQLIMSNEFRAAESSAAADRRQTELAKVGTSRFLTPELLHKKIEAISGYSWTRSYGNNPEYLLSENEYLIFFGGIDFDSVTKRITQPNGLMASVAMRMANEVACKSGPRDFTREDRLLFPYVELSFEPEDENGFEIAGAVDAIMENIQYLHARVLGELLPLDHEEIERTYQIFYETWKEGKEQVSADEVSADLPGSCRAENDLVTGESLPDDERIRRDDRYTVRSWMAVLSYLYSDFRFLYQ
jgi:hypothetical protein